MRKTKRARRSVPGGLPNRWVRGVDAACAVLESCRPPGCGGHGHDYCATPLPVYSEMRSISGGIRLSPLRRPRRSRRPCGTRRLPGPQLHWKNEKIRELANKTRRGQDGRHEFDDVAGRCRTTADDAVTTERDIFDSAFPENFMKLVAVIWAATAIICRSG